MERDPYGSLCGSKFQVIGRTFCDNTAVKYGALLLSTEQLHYSQIYYALPEEAAMMKYIINTFLAMKVTFMNEWFEIAEREHVSWDVLHNLFLLDERVGRSHTLVPGPDYKFGFGGSCFPKDLDAIISEYRDLKVLPAIKKANTKFKERNDG